jgi:hypothetical protein
MLEPTMNPPSPAALARFDEPILCDLLSSWRSDFQRKIGPTFHRDDKPLARTFMTSWSGSSTITTQPAQQ